MLNLHSGGPGWNEAELVSFTNAAFKSYHSVLALARSPLAGSGLVQPLLVLDDVSPTATERGQALRLVLQWAVTQLAPERPMHPLGVYRLVDEPTWQEPLWWRYNILRHRYIDPLHPDEFVEGGRITETLIARMGIPSQDTYFEERNRAIREVAQWLHQQMRQGHAAGELQSLALEAVHAPLARTKNARTLLEIAATFGEHSVTVQPGATETHPRFQAEASPQERPTADDVFPRALLLELAQKERLDKIEESLGWLVRGRYLQAGDDNRNLWMSPMLQVYLYTRQPADRRATRHRRAAAYFEHAGEPLRATLHFLQAGQFARAADLLLATPVDMADELAMAEAARLLERFGKVDLPPGQQSELHIRLADLQAARGERTRALAACRRALKAAGETASTTVTSAAVTEVGVIEAAVTERDGQTRIEQARIYRRMGKLYEKHNQLHALGYYDQAETLFSQNHPEFVTLLKDRGWLHILRQSWSQAEVDLRRALALAPPNHRSQRADIDDALASLYRHQRRFDAAIDFARRALREREALGDLLRVGHSFNNLGLIYNELGDFVHAIAAFEEAIAIFQRLNNLELVAGARLNIGLAHHLGGELGVAIQAYEASLALSRAIELPLVQARAHANLAEAFAALEQADAAQTHWRAGLALSLRAGFDDEVTYYRSLQAQFPALTEAELNSASDSALVAAASPAQTPVSQAYGMDLPPDLDPESQTILALAQAGEKLTSRLVMEELGVSKATATRRLTALAERGILTRYGEGRGVHYVWTSAPANGSCAAQTHVYQPAQAGAQLARHAPALAQEFDLIALGVDASDGQRWYGIFRAWPDVPTFFRLEARLGEMLGTGVNLKPYDAPVPPPDAEGVSTQGEPLSPVIWVWRTQPERSIMD